VFKPLLRHPYARLLFYALALAIIAPLAFRLWERAQPYNGFDLSNAAVPKDRIVGGGPGRDGIPALTDPQIIRAGESDYQPDQPVLGIALNGEARAYPINILSWHEVVNDRLGGEPITVTWCPLCHTGVIYRGRVGDERAIFGVSGLLYQNNLLMYDRKTESLWSQLKGEAISGSRRGRRLEALAFRQTTVGQWLDKHPGATILAPETGYDRDYTVNPYRDYHSDMGGSDKLAERDLVVGVALKGEARAYPFSELARLGDKGRLTDSLAGRSFTLDYDVATNAFSLDMAEGGEQPRTMLSYRFAWRDFHPDTRFFEADAR